MKGKTSGTIWLIFALALVTLMPTNQSLWIDEGFTVPYAQEGSFGDFLSRLDKEKGSEALMPLGMFATWAGAKVFGRSELGLRAVSALWAAFAILLLWRVGLLVGLPWLPALFACHPFLWYYASEVRPYAMVIAMSSGVLYGFVAIQSSERTREHGFRTFLLFGVLLCATQVLGVVPFAVVAAVVAVGILRKRWKPQRLDLATLAASGSALLVLAVHYTRAMSRGADINWVGPWKVGLDNLLFSAYELLGFVGFGPGRYVLRQTAIEHGIGGTLKRISGPAMLGMVVLAFLYVLLLVRLMKRRRSEPQTTDRLALAALFVIAATTGIVFLLCALVGSPFWGRHLAALLPFIVLTVAIGASPPVRIRQRPLAVLPWLLGAMLLSSSLLVRFNPDQSRDDYRDAARIARTAVQQGKTVWWAAAPETAQYYGVEFCAQGADERRCVVRAINADPDALQSLPRPDLIVISKPELHDRMRAVRGYIRGHRFRLIRRLMAFEVFEPH